MTGPTMPYDAYAGDTIHQYFQMTQQIDCAIDKEHVSQGNPTGCLHDLQSAITTTYATPPGSTPHDTGQTMEFFNMQQGDVPLMKALADKYTISDNYHQPVMGGTGPDWFRSASPTRCTSPTARLTAPSRRRRPDTIYNPNPVTRPTAAATSISIRSARSGSIAPTRPRPASSRSCAICASCPTTSPKCAPGAFYNAVNVNPALTPKGAPQAGTVIPAQTIRWIGDVLSAQQHPVEVLRRRLQRLRHRRSVERLLQHLQSVRVSSSAIRRCIADHMRDVVDLFSDIQNGTLPAVVLRQA